MIACLRYLLGWLVNAFRSRQDLILENLAPFVSSCWHCMQRDLAAASPLLRHCSGLRCGEPGQDGNSRSSW